MEERKPAIPASQVLGASTAFDGEERPDNPDFIQALAEHHGIPVELAQQIASGKIVTNTGTSNQESGK